MNLQATALQLHCNCKRVRDELASQIAKPLNDEIEVLTRQIIELETTNLSHLHGPSRTVPAKQFESDS
jgi:hypothetical protein